MGRRFDDFAKALAGNLSRRQTLKGTLAAVLGLGAGALAGRQAASADEDDRDRLIRACCRFTLGSRATHDDLNRCVEAALHGTGVCAHVRSCCPEGQICIQIQAQGRNICVPAFDD